MHLLKVIERAGFSIENPHIGKISGSGFGVVFVTIIVIVALL